MGLGQRVRSRVAQSRRESERQRVPAPLLKRRLPSGRGAMEQPNVTSDPDAPQTARFWVAVVATGVVTGLFGDFLMWVLYWAERVGFGYVGGSVEAAVKGAGELRRVVALAAAAVIGSVAWYLIRRFLAREHAEIDEVLWTGAGKLGFRRSLLTSLTSEVVVGLGASIGREAAPKLMGGASASVLGEWFGLTPGQVRLLVACGGGAGLACVYNVPFGGALFTAEVLYGSYALPVALPALATSFIATTVAWAYLPSRATYVNVPLYHFSATIMVWSLAAGVVIGLLAVLYVRLIGVTAHYRSRGAHIFWTMPLAFLALAGIGTWYPQLFGNGKGMAHDAFLGAGSVGLLFALAMLKPLVTAAVLGSGASGGLFTPFLSTGAVLGAFLGAVWSHLWPGAPVGAFALVGAAAMIGASMQAPFVGLVLVMELSHGGYDLVVPMIAATVIATLLVRWIDGYSIYSARLPYTERAHD